MKWAYILLVSVGGAMSLAIYVGLRFATGDHGIVWGRPWALWLLACAGLSFWLGAHRRRRRVPTLAFSRVGDARAVRPGGFGRIARLPVVLRAVSLALFALAVAQPQTYEIDAHARSGIDVMIALDLSQSMAETDLHPTRLDAGRRTIVEFLSHRRGDRIGLVAFAEVPVVQCPLTTDYDALVTIARDLVIGDIPDRGTAIGDAVGLALASLDRSTSLTANGVQIASKAIILISDGDSNKTTYMSPNEAKNLARTLGVRVFAVLVGSESEGDAGQYHVDAELLASLASATGGRFFRAGDDAALSAAFDEVREVLDKTRQWDRQRVPTRELFGLFAWPGAILFALELLLGMTRLRRFP